VVKVYMVLQIMRDPLWYMQGYQLLFINIFWKHWHYGDREMPVVSSWGGYCRW